MATTEAPEKERGLKSVKDMATDGAETPIEEEDDGQLAIGGTKPNLNLSAGGQKPSTSIAQIKSLKLPVRNPNDLENPGQFEKGDTIRCVVDLVVTEVNFKDDRRKGRVERVQRIHVFEPLAIEVLPAVPDKA